MCETYKILGNDSPRTSSILLLYVKTLFPLKNVSIFSQMSRKRKAVYKITCIFTSFVRIFLGVERIQNPLDELQTIA